MARLVTEHKPIQIISRLALVLPLARGGCALALLAALLNASCSARQETKPDASLKIQIPSVSTLQATTKPALSGYEKIGAQTVVYDWSRACFIANVRGQGIADTVESSCDIAVGAFSGSVAPGESLSLNIARGVSRRLEIFAYFRATSAEACPALQKGFGSLRRTQVVRVGEVPNFNVDKDSVEVEVNLTMPAQSINLLTQYTLPASCQPPVSRTPPATAYRGSLQSAAGVIKGGGMAIVGTVSDLKSEVKLTGGGFKMRLSRSPQE